MATAGVRARAPSVSSGAMRAHEDRLALQGETKRPILAPERRGSTRHAGGKGAMVALLPAPFQLTGFLPAAGPVFATEPLAAFLCIHSRSARGPPAALS